MVTAKTTLRAAATARPRQATKSSATKELGDDEKLAKDLERVLRFSQPKKVEPKPGRAAPSLKASRTVTSDSATKATKSPIVQPIIKGKAKATAEEFYPWDAPELSSADRARFAMRAINENTRSLGLATQAGYRYSSGKTVEEWPDDKVNGAVVQCEAALRSLRVQAEMGELGKKVIEVEKAAQGLIQKCLGLAMVCTVAAWGDYMS